jgi:hypothetical protein
MEMPPAGPIHSISVFAPLFTERVWQHVQTLLGGALLAPGKRTVSAALRMMVRRESQSAVQPLDVIFHPTPPEVWGEGPQP